MMKNFTFVTHSKGGRPEKAELVKSHVMREAQRKRREDRQRRQRIVNGSLYAFSSPTSDSLRNASNTADKLDRSSVPTFLPPANTSTHSSIAKDPVLASSPWTSYHTRATDSVSHLDGLDCSLRKDSSYLFRDGSPSSLKSILSNLSGDSYEDVSIALHKFVERNSNLDQLYSDIESPPQPAPLCFVPLIRQPSIRYATAVGGTRLGESTWMSRDLFNRVVELTWHYGNTLLVERAGHPPVNPCMYWQHASLTKPTVLLTCALFHCAYQDIVIGTSSTHHEYYKAKALQFITAAMSDPDTAISDDNIASVLSLCMYENLRGSKLLMTHLKGLRQMVDMRGGINNLPADQGQHLSENIILQDLIHATCSNVPPFLIDIYGPILRDVRGMGREYFYPQSPLRVVDDAIFDQLDMRLQSSSAILKDAFDGLEMLHSEAFDPNFAVNEDEAIESRRGAIRVRLSYDEQNEDMEGMPDTLEKRAEEATRLAAIIHFRAVALKVQHDHESNVLIMKQLHNLVRKVDITFWKIAPYTYLWIQLTGGAAAHKHPDYRPYFVSEIMRLGLSVGLFDWRPFRQIMGNFLWLQQYLRRHSSRSPDIVSSHAGPDFSQVLASMLDNSSGH